MIKEDYCSFKIAELLKKKGFEGDCDYYYDTVETDEPQQLTLDEKLYFRDRYIDAPTHQMAMKWLRDKGIEIIVIPVWQTLSKVYRSYVLSDLGNKYKDFPDSYSDNTTYEEAVETALKC